MELIATSFAAAVTLLLAHFAAIVKNRITGAM
jgi:hypothetical protein